MKSQLSLRDLDAAKRLSFEPFQELICPGAAYCHIERRFGGGCDFQSSPYLFSDALYGLEGDTRFDGQPAKKGYHASVPFRMDQQAWADAYFNSVIHPLENMGVDFWWLDWQQWKESKYVQDLSNTYWLNYTFFNDKVRRNRNVPAYQAERPMTYHRSEASHASLHQ